MKLTVYKQKMGDIGKVHTQETHRVLFDFTFPSNNKKYSSLVSSSTWLNLLINVGKFFFFIVFVGIVLHYISNRMFLVKMFSYVKKMLPNRTCICSPAI